MQCGFFLYCLYLTITMEKIPHGEFRLISQRKHIAVTKKELHSAQPEKSPTLEEFLWIFASVFFTSVF